MHLRTGDKVEFVVDENGNVLVIPITSLKGIVPPPKKVVSLEDMEEGIAERAEDT